MNQGRRCLGFNLLPACQNNPVGKEEKEIEVEETPLSPVGRVKSRGMVFLSFLPLWLIFVLNVPLSLVIPVLGLGQFLGALNSVDVLSHKVIFPSSVPSPLPNFPHTASCMLHYVTQEVIRFEVSTRVSPLNQWDLPHNSSRIGQ